MKRCPECGTNNDDDNKFCRFCGEVLGEKEEELSVEQKVCRKCGQPMEPEEKFCAFCGEPVEKPLDIGGDGAEEEEDGAVDADAEGRGRKWYRFGHDEDEDGQDDDEDDEDEEDDDDEDDDDEEDEEDDEDDDEEDEDDDDDDDDEEDEDDDDDDDDEDDDDEDDSVEAPRRPVLPIIAAAFVVAAALLVSVAVWATKLQNAQPAKEREQSHILFTQESEPSEVPVSMPAVIEEESEVSELPESSIVSEVEIPTTVYGDPIILDASISASSSLDTDTYGTANLKDFDATTAWAEGVSGNGTGETLTFTFDGECNVYGIALMPGYFKSADLYKANAAPLELEVSGGDFRTVVDLRGFEADFSNLNNDFKYIDFATPVHTSSLKVTITDVRDGSRYDDMSISELHFYTYSSTPEGAITGTPSIAGPTYEEPEEEEEEEPQEEEEEPEAVSGDYILPESNTRYLTTSDLKGLTKAQCRLARNEIYARHGRGFDDPELQAYFNGKSWYTCTISASEWSSRGYESTLNDYEAANRDLIVQYENSL